MATIKYTPETAKELNNEKLISELIEAHKDNIATGNPNFSILKEENLRRLNEADALKAANTAQSTDSNPAGQGGWKDQN